MKMVFDGYRESLMADHCLDENGRLVVRDDLEAIEECRQAYQLERQRQKLTIERITFIALGMLIAVGLVLISNG